jgi:hypothetical protein
MDADDALNDDALNTRKDGAAARAAPFCFGIGRAIIRVMLFRAGSSEIFHARAQALAGASVPDQPEQHLRSALAILINDPTRRPGAACTCRRPAKESICYTGSKKNVKYVTVNQTAPVISP